MKLNIPHEPPLLVLSCYSELRGHKNLLDNWIEAKEHASTNTKAAAQKDGSLSHAPFFHLVKLENIK